jgi:hypothetical protein
MHRTSRVRAGFVFTLLALFVLGCGAPVTIHIRLPGFGAGAVNGIWLWKLTPAGFVRACRFDISDPSLQGGKEMVSYQQSCSDGRPQPQGLVWEAVVTRLASSPSTAELVLSYLPYGAQALYKASAFNSAGESTLSSTVLVL